MHGAAQPHPHLGDGVGARLARRRDDGLEKLVQVHEWRVHRVHAARGELPHQHGCKNPHKSNTNRNTVTKIKSKTEVVNVTVSVTVLHLHPGFDIINVIDRFRCR